MRRICWPKETYFWKCKGMFSKIFGDEGFYEGFKDYVNEIDTFQGLYTVAIMMFHRIRFQTDWKVQKNNEKKKGLNTDAVDSE